MTATTRRHALMLALTVLLMLLLAPLAVAQERTKYTERDEGTHIVDEARVLSADEQSVVEAELQTLLEETGLDVVIYTQEKKRVGARKGAREEAAALLEEWGVGGEAGNGASSSGTSTRIAPSLEVGSPSAAPTPATSPPASMMPSSTWSRAGCGRRIFGRPHGWVCSRSRTSFWLRRPPRPAAGGAPDTEPRRHDAARDRGHLRSATQHRVDSLAAGPDYPDAREGVRVYDYAEVLGGDAIRRLSESIEAIEERTGAQIVIYTQTKPDAADDAAATERDAIALIDQWGVGREGFDDGMAIFFNLRDDCHGQVQLYAGPGAALHTSPTGSARRSTKT